MGKDIETLLWSAKFSSKKEIIKYLRDKDCFDRCISYICSCLKRNCLKYSKIVLYFQKNLLEIKKKFPQNQKKFLRLDEKNNLFNQEKFLLSFSTLI